MILALHFTFRALPSLQVYELQILQCIPLLHLDCDDEYCEYIVDVSFKVLFLLYRDSLANRNVPWPKYEYDRFSLYGKAHAILDYTCETFKAMEYKFLGRMNLHSGHLPQLSPRAAFIIFSRRSCIGATHPRRLREWEGECPGIVAV